MHTYRIELDEDEVESALGLDDRIYVPTVFYVKADVFDQTGDVELFKVQSLNKQSCPVSGDELTARLGHTIKAEVRQQYIRRFYNE